MQLEVSSWLLSLLTTICILTTTAFAQTHNWLFPAIAQRPDRLIFESQDTIIASWTSDFVSPMLYMPCQINNDGDWSVSKDYSTLSGLRTS